MGRRTWLLLWLGACASAPPDAPIERVGRQVEGARRDLALCYHDARLAGAEVRAVDFVVTIDFAEDPPRLRVREGTSLDARLRACVLGVLEAVDFPPMEPTTIDVPIRAPR